MKYNSIMRIVAVIKFSLIFEGKLKKISPNISKKYVELILHIFTIRHTIDCNFNIF